MARSDRREKQPPDLRRRRTSRPGSSGPTANEGGAYTSQAVHQANTDVDERGTDAAATAVLGDTAGCNGPTPAKWITLRFDRPFLFVLRDVPTGAVLFMGRVVDPSARS